MTKINNKTLNEKKTYEHESTISVVCATDNNYAMPLAVTMISAIENLDDRFSVIFYIIDGGLTNSNRLKILKSVDGNKCEVKFIKITDSLKRKIEKVHSFSESELTKSRPEHVSIASFYRILIPDILPKEIEKIIYLDCDLVVKGDLSQLWQKDLGSNDIMAVQDTWTPLISSEAAELKYEELKICPDLPYLNAGVLVINLKKWRSEEFCTKALTYFEENLKYIGLYDQGLLNALLANKWGQLDPRWNFNVTSFYDYFTRKYKSWENVESFLPEIIYNKLIHEPYIFHYVSDNKPWISRQCPSREIFFEYVDKTKWKGWRISLARRLWRKLIPSRRNSIDWL